MNERSYTVLEIDALRAALTQRWLFGTSIPQSGHSRCFREEEKAAAVEQLVRTHMLAGHVANDIYEADRRSQP